MIGGLNQRPDVCPGAPPLGPQTRTAAATHRPAGRPVPPDAISGMTYRYEQAVRSAAQITPAEYALPAAMPSVCVARAVDHPILGNVDPLRHRAARAQTAADATFRGRAGSVRCRFQRRSFCSVMGWNGRLAGALACLRRGGDRRLAAGLAPLH